MTCCATIGPLTASARVDAPGADQEFAAGEPDHVGALKRHRQCEDGYERLEQGLAVPSRKDGGAYARRQRQRDHDEKVAIHPQEEADQTESTSAVQVGAGFWRSNPGNWICCNARSSLVHQSLTKPYPWARRRCPGRQKRAAMSPRF